VRAGLTVACALEGAVLGPEFTIKKAKIRGVESRGMLCSQRELGLSDEHAGIMELPPHWRVGAALKEYYPDDAVVEVEVTPNRGDCLSMRGIAREVAARAGTRIKPMSQVATQSGGSVADCITVRIDDAAACPRYMGRLGRHHRAVPRLAARPSDSSRHTSDQ
jgi:phenylalanyl-tRNA synthetase beta chain